MFSPRCSELIFQVHQNAMFSQKRKAFHSPKSQILKWIVPAIGKPIYADKQPDEQSDEQPPEQPDSIPDVYS